MVRIGSRLLVILAARFHVPRRKMRPTACACRRGDAGQLQPAILLKTAFIFVVTAYQLSHIPKMQNPGANQ
jgi:hypothetical protein